MVVAQAGRIGRQNSKKAICTTGWKNGNEKSIFEIFSPTSPNGIYSYYNIKDIPIYNSPLSAYVTIICGFNLLKILLKSCFFEKRLPIFKQRGIM